MSIIGNILVKLGLDSSEFTRGARDAERQTQSTTSKIGGAFKNLVGGLAIGAAIKKAFDFGKEAYMAAAQAEGVKIAFDRLNDPNLLNNLKSATKGTVDELKLMQLSVQAKNFKLPVEQLGTYLKFATKRAQETGMSVDYLTNSIITGLGRKSVLILDNLGISAVEIREEMAKGGDMAKSVGTIIDREMAKAGDVIETSAIKTERLSASWSNLVGTIGETSIIKKGGDAIVDTLTYIANSADALFKSEKLSGWERFLGFIGHKGYQQQALFEQSDVAKRDAEEQRRLNDYMNTIKTVEQAETELAQVKTMYHNAKFDDSKNWYVRCGVALDNYIKKSKIAEEEAKQNVLTLDGLNEIISAKTQDFNLESDPNKQKAIAKEIKYYEAKKNAIEDLIKTKDKEKNQTFSYKEGENTSAITQLEKQASVYGNTIVYMEQMLKLRREQEQFAKSTEEYNRIKKENDELEKQVKLRKVDYQKGSELDLKSQLSDAETEMSKLNTRTEEGRKRFAELNKIIENINWQIAHLPQNITIDYQVDFDGLNIDSMLNEAFKDWDEYKEKIKQSALDLQNTLEQGVEHAIMGLGEAIGNLASGNTDAVWQALLNPIADMAVQLGQLAIVAGITFDALGNAMKNPFGGGIGAIAAGVALVALGSAIKGAISNIGSGGGGSSGGYGNTFTGGYSNGGSTRTAQSLQLVSPQSQQTIVVKGQLTGGQLKFILGKEDQRIKR